MRYGNTAAIAAAGRCQECPVRDLGVCAAAGTKAAAAFARRARLNIFRAGTTILRQGEEIGHAGIIVDGTVKIVSVTEAGATHVLQLLSPGDAVGTPFLARAGVAWEAATDVSLCWIALPVLETLLREEPFLGSAFLASAYRQQNAQWEWAVLLRTGGTLRRLANWMLGELTETVTGGVEGRAVVIELRRRDLASLLDMTVETLCRGLHQLEQRRAIVMRTPKQAAIRDIEMLRLIARGERGPRIGKAAVAGRRANISGTAAPMWNIASRSQEGYPQPKPAGT